MTGLYLQELLNRASPSLGPANPVFPTDVPQLSGSLLTELTELYALKNGFLAFESALHVFPIGNDSNSYDLVQWNSPDLWRQNYGAVAQGYLFFAQDIFGEQFCLKDDYLWRFDPETGAAIQIATGFEEWASRILADYEYETGYTLAHEWQMQHGPVPIQSRLVPIIPFVLGGEYKLENLHLLEAAKSMQLRATIANQIRDLPNSAQVKIKIG